jgi:hypothetical protein
MILYPNKIKKANKSKRNVVQVNYLVLERRPRVWLFEILDDEVGLRRF